MEKGKREKKKMITREHYLLCIGKYQSEINLGEIHNAKYLKEWKVYYIFLCVLFLFAYVLLLSVYQSRGIKIMLSKGRNISVVLVWRVHRIVDAFGLLTIFNFALGSRNHPFTCTLHWQI